MIVLAQEEARNLGHSYIGTEHLLLGLIREEEGLAARVLKDHFDLTYSDVFRDTNRIVGAEEKKIEGQQLPFTPRAKKVLELSLRESLSLGHNYVGTEHILLGLVREEEGVAKRILLDHDITAQQVRDEIISVLSGPKQEVKQAERDKLWTPAKTEEENSKKFGPSELAVNSVRGQVITISGDLTLEVDHDIYGRLNILIRNPSGLPVQISEK